MSENRLTIYYQSFFVRVGCLLTRTIPLKLDPALAKRRTARALTRDNSRLVKKTGAFRGVIVKCLLSECRIKQFRGGGREPGSG